MAAGLGRSDSGPEPLLVVRLDGGAWYELPVEDLERARITDRAALGELQSQLAAGGFTATTNPAGDEIPIAFLPDETLATYRAGPERAAAREANGDVAGFHDLEARHYNIYGNHRQMTVVKVIQTPGTGTGPNGETYLTGIPVLTLAMGPSVRFDGGTPYVRSYQI